jgi:hypothetical protein
MQHMASAVRFRPWPPNDALRLMREGTLYIERRLISDEKWQLCAGDDSFR